jgi:hypothetical protein
VSTQPYAVYIGATPITVNLSPTATMDEVRTALGSQISDQDSFLYENPVTELKTVLTPTSAEKTARLSVCCFPPVPEQGVTDSIIQVVSTSTSSPSFMGTTPESGYLSPNPYFGVNVRLNEVDKSAIDNNKGMFQPVLLENVQSCNPDNPANFTYAVICQKGAIVEFDISCWGAAGFSFTITSAMSESADINSGGLYVCYGDDSFNKISVTGLRRYNSQSGDTIQIEANAALGIAAEYNVEYSTVTCSGWSLNQWTDMDGNTHASSTPIPGSAMSESIETKTTSQADSGGFQPGPPAGTGSIPGGTTQPATPTAGPPSNQTFGGIESASPGSKPSTRAEGLVGAIDVFFLVFDSQEDANTVIKILNSGTMGFGS